MDKFGTIAEFKDPTELYNAAIAVRKEGYNKIETYSPFPIHGMDDACGLKASKMPWLSLIGGNPRFDHRYFSTSMGKY